MKKLLPKLIITGCLNLMIISSINAQLFETIELYPNTQTIKGKYYNGSGGGGYWTLDFVDSTGRIICKESYRKKQLLFRTKYVYDEYNSKIFEIETFDISHPETIDTNRYEYKYANNRIIYQYQKYSDNDSTVIKMIENQGDTLIVYQEQGFRYRPNIKRTDVIETIYTLKYRNGLMISNETFHPKDKSTKTTKYEYFENGRKKRRVIDRIPEPKLKGTYVGGPGSDDELYEYKLDSKGRVLKFYKIIDGKKYNIASYKYKK